MAQGRQVARRDAAGGASPPGKAARRRHLSSLSHPKGGLDSPMGALGALARYLQVSGLRFLTPHGAAKAVPNVAPIEFRP